MTRRDFMEDTAVGGIAFVACGLQGEVGGAQAQTRRREVVVNGKQVRTVDIHAHCAVPEAMALMNLKVTGQPNLPNVLVMTQPTDRLRAMDEQGIDMEALSINPYWYKAERDWRSRSARSRTPSSARRARRIPIGSSPSRRCRCSIQTSPPSCWRRP